MFRDKTGLIGAADLKTFHVRVFYWFMMAVLLLLSLVCLVPPLWVMLSSVKDIKEFIQVPPTIIPRSFHPEKLVESWKMLDFTRYYINTVVITVISVGSSVVFNGLAGYVISKLKPKGYRLIFGMMMGTMMLPGAISLVSTYQNIISLPGIGANLLNTYWPAFMMSGANTFLIIVYKSFFDGIPESLLEAAKLDGCNEFSIFTRIVLPISKPVIFTTIILTVNSVWGDFFWPSFILKKKEVQTIMLALMGLKGNYSIDIQLCGLTFAIVPPAILFLCFQRHIMQGFTMSGIKG